MSFKLSLSVVIPTYKREEVLLNTIRSIVHLDPTPSEILVVDQSQDHKAATVRELTYFHENGSICWIRLPSPSITHAMNVGLERAREDIVLFLDDDIIPSDKLVESHLRAHNELGCNVVAGQVLQPGEEPWTENTQTSYSRFAYNSPRHIIDFIGANFSVKRSFALNLGGFDENFVHVAYCYEKEFSERVIAAGGKIYFVPEASVRHLKASDGGTRSYGHHLTTVKPSHAVGAYYYLLRSRKSQKRFLQVFARPFKAVKTRHHFLHPWWIVPTIMSEFMGLLWSVLLISRGPRLLNSREINGDSND